MNVDHWQAVRDAGLRALEEEAERRWPDHPLVQDEMDLAREAFIAGGEWAMEQFVKAAETRG